MHPISSRGAPPAAHPEAQPSVPDIAGLSWEALQSFLQVVRCGSYRSAERHCGVSASQLRRRVEALERQVGRKLLISYIQGVQPTPDGNHVLAAAGEMEAALLGALRPHTRKPSPMEGVVRIATTEALGAFWLTPHLVEFQRSYPRLLVEMQCAMRSADVLRLEAHLAIQLNPPTAPDLIVTRIARIHSIPAAAPSYLETYSVPKSLDDLREHRILGQFAEQTRTREAFEMLFPGRIQEHVVYRTNNSSALLWGIVKGLGIGWSPTYIHFLGPRMVSLDLGLVFPHDVWLTYHPKAIELPHVRRVINWVKEVFDPVKYPWFRDEYIHPHQLAKLYRGPPLPNLFEGLSWTADEYYERYQRHPDSIQGG